MMKSVFQVFLVCILLAVQRSVNKFDRNSLMKFKSQTDSTDRIIFVDFDLLNHYEAD